MAKRKASRSSAPSTEASGPIYQFKITLLGSRPAIWRRIQIADCSLDKLHEYIQTVMGWTNSHLHEFVIGENHYGDPELLEDIGVEYADSTKTRIGDILPGTSKKFRFTYLYDFGDSWEHEVCFEKCVEAVKGTKLPICLEGERAGPPDDCGGVWGYADLLEALADPKHEEHEDMKEWIGGEFDPEEFSATAATKAMKKGLPDWRTGYGY